MGPIALGLGLYFVRRRRLWIFSPQGSKITTSVIMDDYGRQLGRQRADDEEVKNLQSAWFALMLCLNDSSVTQNEDQKHGEKKRREQKRKDKKKKTTEHCTKIEERGKKPDSIGVRGTR